MSTGGGDLNSHTLLPNKLKTEIALHVNLETLKKVSDKHKSQSKTSKFDISNLELH